MNYKSPEWIRHEGELAGPSYLQHVRLESSRRVPTREPTKHRNDRGATRGADSLEANMFDGLFEVQASIAVVVPSRNRLKARCSI